MLLVCVGQGDPFFGSCIMSTDARSPRRLGGFLTERMSFAKASLAPAAERPAQDSIRGG